MKNIDVLLTDIDGSHYNDTTTDNHSPDFDSSFLFRDFNSDCFDFIKGNNSNNQFLLGMDLNENLTINTPHSQPSQTNSSSNHNNETTCDEHNNNINNKKSHLIKLKNNRESARRSRKRKKETLDWLIKENLELRRQIGVVKTKLHSTLCRNCKEKVGIVQDGKKGVVVEKEGMMSQRNYIKPLLLFTTFTMLIWCVFLNVVERIVERK